MANIHQKCLICSGDDLQPVKRFVQHHLVRCCDCGSVFSKVIPTNEELYEYYADYPVKDYRSPVTIRRYNELLDQFELFRTKNHLLDIGCGTGYFLDEAKKRKWGVFGTEYSPESVLKCRQRGLSIHQGALDPSQYGGEQFDMITSFEVIEHINDPRDEIDRIHKILRPGGMLYITTPNFNSISKYVAGSKWNIVNFPEHLCYYTPTTLHRLLVNKGFERLWVKTTGISISRFKTSHNIEGQENVNPENDDEKLRSKMESNILLKMAKRVLNSILNLFGIGDSLKAAYIKR